MSPETTNLVAPLITISFIVYCGYKFHQGYVNHKTVKPLKIPDRFDIGYIDDPVVPPTVVNVYTPAPPMPAPKVGETIDIVSAKVGVGKSMLQPESKERTALKEQCLYALMGLGESQTSAKKKADQIIDANPDIKDVAAFLRKAVV